MRGWEALQELVEIGAYVVYGGIWGEGQRRAIGYPRHLDGWSYSSKNKEAKKRLKGPSTVTCCSEAAVGSPQAGIHS